VGSTPTPHGRGQLEDIVRGSAPRTSRRGGGGLRVLDADWGFDPLVDVADVVAATASGCTWTLRRRRRCLAAHRHLVADWTRRHLVDAHKICSCPRSAHVVLSRAGARFEAFQQDAPYLFDPGPGLAEYDSALRTWNAQAGGRVRLWACGRCGVRAFRRLVDVTLLWVARLREAGGRARFRPLNEPECNIVAFRTCRRAPRRPGRCARPLQLELRRKVIEAGDFYLVSTKMTPGALRVTINPLTTPSTSTACSTRSGKRARDWGSPP